MVAFIIANQTQLEHINMKSFTSVGANPHFNRFQGPCALVGWGDNVTVGDRAVNDLTLNA